MACNVYRRDQHTVGTLICFLLILDSISWDLISVPFLLVLIYRLFFGTDPLRSKIPVLENCTDVLLSK